MPETRTLYAKASDHVVPIGGTAEAKQFVNTALGMDWVPTVVNPSDGSRGLVDRALFWAHILVWVAALITSCISNFGVGMFMSKNDSYVPCTSVGVPDNCGGNGGTGEGYPGVWASPTTITIGILGGISSVIGVILLLGGAAWFDKDQYKQTVWLNALVQFFTLYGTVCTYYVFSEAGVNTETGFFTVSLLAVIFCSYAQILLYCTSAALDVLALPRAFIPSLTGSVQLVSALAISSGDFAPAATDAQKVVAWFVPILTLAALVIMVALRRLTRRESDSISQLGDRPFLRSLVLAPFMGSAILSVYKLSFVKLDTNPTAYMFAFLGLLLNFVIVSVVFVPGGGSFAAQLQD